MNIDQQRAAFEAWLSRHCDYDDLNKSEIELANEAWQAALESQDRDAERYRAWRKAAATNNGNFLRLVSNELPDWDEGPVDESRVDAAIDHARRVEGMGNE